MCVLPVTLSQKPWDKSKLWNICITFTYFFFVNAISIPFILCLGILRCVFSKTWFGIFCSADRLPGAMQFCTIFLSVQNCNYIPSWSILKSKNPLEKHRVYRNCITVVLQTLIISLHEVHLTHNFYTEDVQYWPNVWDDVLEGFSNLMIPLEIYIQ